MWLIALTAIPITGFYEEFQINGDNPDFRLGWIHLIGPATACTLSFFASTLARYRILYSIFSCATVIFVVVISFIIAIITFGLPGIQ